MPLSFTVSSATPTSESERSMSDEMRYQNHASIKLNSYSNVLPIPRISALDERSLSVSFSQFHSFTFPKTAILMKSSFFKQVHNTLIRSRTSASSAIDSFDDRSRVPASFTHHSSALNYVFGADASLPMGKHGISMCDV